MIPIVMMDQKRITYIPQPPSLKCFQTAAIERPPSLGSTLGRPRERAVFLGCPIPFGLAGIRRGHWRRSAHNQSVAVARSRNLSERTRAKQGLTRLYEKGLCAAGARLTRTHDTRGKRLDATKASRA